jgi:COP9 signalosome complex subunit 2
MTKLNFLVLHRPNDALKTYTELLTYTKSAVTRNYSEKTINGILDYVGGGKGGHVEVEILEKFYQATRKALQEAKNERLSVKTNLKLAKLWLDRQEYTRLAKVNSFSLPAVSALTIHTVAYPRAACRYWCHGR